MKTTVLMAMAALIGNVGRAASMKAPAERTVTVCFEKESAGETADKAEMIASKMFHTIGVMIEWRSGRRMCRIQQNEVIAVSLSTNTPQKLLPGALAYALPYEGIHIEIFYDRMAQLNADVLPYILAHVLVHEITHILQGVNQHSDSGIMKARWEQDDYSHMDTKPLSFTEADVDLIYIGLHARASHLCLVGHADGSDPGGSRAQADGRQVRQQGARD